MRIDKWLFTVRFCKSRSIAGNFCESGKVSCNGVVIKASKTIKINDEITIKTKDRNVVYQVLSLPDKRSSATIASKCYLDKSPEYNIDKNLNSVVARDRGTGRPSKKERRDLDKFKS